MKQGSNTSSLLRLLLIEGRTSLLVELCVHPPPSDIHLPRSDFGVCAPILGIRLRDCGGRLRRTGDARLQTQITMQGRLQRACHGAMRYERIPCIIHGTEGQSSVANYIL